MEALVTVLLVEDNESVRKVLSTVLEMKGYMVFQANGAQEAREISQSYNSPIHLLLTDVVMPQTSGPELASQLMAHRPEMRVLFMSGYPEETSHPDGDLPPGTLYLQKPISMDVLLNRIQELLHSTTQR